MIPFISSSFYYIFSLVVYVLLALVSFEYYAVKYKISENALNQFMSNVGVPFKWMFIKNYLIMRILLFGKSSKTPIEEFQKYPLWRILYTRIMVAIFCLIFMSPPIVNIFKETEPIWILDRIIFSALSVITFLGCFYFGRSLSKVSN